MQRYLIVLWMLVLVGCTSTAETALITPTITPIPPCADWTISDENVTCLSLAEGMLIQSGLEQVTLQAYNASIVVYGTVLILGDDTLRILVLEGDAVVGARGQNRILSLGHEVSLMIVDNAAEAPSAIAQIENLPEKLPLEELPRSIDETLFISTPTASPTAIPSVTPQAEDCVTPTDWTDSYTVEAGDTLARIANRFDVSVEALGDGNCLDDVSRIIVGQELFVPLLAAEETDTPEITESASIAIGFRADAYSVESGTCTILRWDAFTVQAIYLDEVLVSANSSQEICPDETTSYSLHVVYMDNSEDTCELIIAVQE